MLRCGREHSIIRLSIFSGKILSRDNSNEKNCEIIEWINNRNTKMHHNITQHSCFFKFTKFKIFSGKNIYRQKIESFFQIEWFKGINLLKWKNLETKRNNHIIPYSFSFFSETIYYVFIIRIILFFLKIKVLLSNIFLFWNKNIR